jgi:hypothetical protein
MRTALDRRVPVHELYVVAAMLDLSQRQLRSMQHYLLETCITAVDLLSKYTDIYIGDDQTEIQQVEVTRASFQEAEAVLPLGELGGRLGRQVSGGGKFLRKK